MIRRTGVHLGRSKISRRWAACAPELGGSIGFERIAEKENNIRPERGGEEELRS
jgi:hypothetical protein